ncbi:hypothetical protein [Candidatus Marithrix sp. Canyon 246]|uniref:hypothetical protein n=1 Tax=Candidatus Marithrix sp. Canyon 246 TaxID=1827136 RepID=UPI00084A0532|nr:hypothetical protein [Candidatus Marithrix sp. Canyon 246]
MDNNKPIYVKIICDGLSDYLVIKKLISAIFEHSHADEVSLEFIEFEQYPNVRDYIDEFIDKSKDTNYDLFHENVKSSKNNIITALIQVVDALTREISISNTDSEKPLIHKENYLKRRWAYSLNAFLELAIEEFYQKRVEWGYDYQSLPLILPLVLFPSIEILVAACFESDGNFDERYRSLEAKPHLKQKVWETDSIHEALTTGMFDDILNEYIVPENLNLQIPFTLSFKANGVKSGIINDNCIATVYNIIILCLPELYIVCVNVLY